jgi:hypothetical protein
MLNRFYCQEKKFIGGALVLSPNQAARDNLQMRRTINKQTNSMAGNFMKLSLTEIN